MYSKQASENIFIYADNCIESEKGLVLIRHGYWYLPSSGNTISILNIYIYIYLYIYIIIIELSLVPKTVLDVRSQVNRAV